MAKKAKNKIRRIESFDFEPGDLLAGKYEVLSELGRGWEGEVYLVRERRTRVERAAKLFLPHRNPGNRAIRFYARKLHKLRHCPILIQYHTQEELDFNGTAVTFLTSEYVEGELLSSFQKRQPGKRLHPYEGMQLLHTMAAGVEQIHHAREYHGDLHSGNVIVRRRGISFDVKLVDMYDWGPPKPESIREDVCDLVRLFYDALGGARTYSRQPPEVKAICCGLKRSLILRKFRTAGKLREYLETFEWG